MAEDSSQLNVSGQRLAKRGETCSTTVTNRAAAHVEREEESVLRDIMTNDSHANAPKTKKKKLVIDKLRPPNMDHFHHFLGSHSYFEERWGPNNVGPN